MRLALIGCMVMNREISHLISESENIVRPWWLRQGLHDTPDLLRAELQRTVDEIERENSFLPEQLRFSAIVLAYGLCSNGVVGVRSRSLPIIVPRCDDCISLFLGSAERYKELFREIPGAYWYNAGWIDQAFTPSSANYDRKMREYVERYGEENAAFLMECECGWMEKYQNCCFISSPLGDRPDYEEYARQAAKDFNWQFRRVEGSMNYLNSLINGPWERSQFLTCPPHSRIEGDYTGQKLRSVPAELDDRIGKP